MKPKIKELLWLMSETFATVITIVTIILVTAAIISGMWQYPG